MNYIQSILLGFIEGITEFLPISSTGHMIIAAYFMGIMEKEFTKLFLISVQVGAVCSVLFLYRKKFFLQKKDFYIKLVLACIPIVFVGFFFKNQINFFLEKKLIVAFSLIIGGFIIIQLENFYEKKIHKSNHITYLQAFNIGLFQCLSVIPGVSRSATIIAACMIQKINRNKAIEFSFFLSLPVIGMATCKKLFDHFFQLNYLSYKFYFLEFVKNIKYKDLFIIQQEIKLLMIGNIVSFITALLSIKFFVDYLKNNNFRLFGYYRIILGMIFVFIHYFIKPIGKL
ncbi:undecaprenyl-diphosphate phosphatase [Blattabacterium cuenoti]|uniref:undecaprenyl-diphosphate phosphatase n=1 Tax=Blattabacterium cuenoti TaxID=1653831 RepID=UPI00163D1437|nr:undecaprenyl-diphosphate phosphatase [Blattabacterium cuenoti]